MQIKRPVLITFFILGFSATLAAQGLYESWRWCKGTNTNFIILGCTAVIQKGGETSARLAGAHYNRGRAYETKGEYDCAAQDFDQAIRLKPDFGSSYLGRANAYKDLGQYDRAIQDYDQVIRLKPDYAGIFNSRGRVKFYLARFPEAALDFQDALGLNSSDAYAVLWLHLAKKKAGQDDSQAFTQQVGEMDSSKWPAPIANLFLGKLTPEETLAAAANRKSSKEKEHLCEAEFYIGEYLLLHQEIPGALVRFRAALDTCPHNFVEYEGAGAELARLSR